MAYPRLDVVDPLTGSTVLFSLNDQAGAVNPNGFKTKLGAVRFGTNTQIDTAESEGTPGGTVTRYHDAIWTSSAFLHYEATSPDIAAASLGVLARWLGEGGLMIWQREASSEERYIDFLPSPRFAQLVGEHLADLARGPDGITVEFLMQPGVRGTTVTTAEVTVPNDPATGTPGSRIVAVNAEGDLPTPGRVRVKMDSGATVERILVGHRAQKSRPASFFSDYLAETGWFQCEASGRGWTISLGSDTAATTDGALASPATGNVVAQVNAGGSTAEQMLRRVRATRTTLMDSLRGSWVPYLRCKVVIIGAWEVQLRWGPSTADPVAFAEPPVTHDSFGGAYVELPMGKIEIPQTVALGGLAVEIWARLLDGSASSDLNLDLVDLWPADGLASVVVPGGASTQTNGLQMFDGGSSPPYKLTADATWIAGAVVQTTKLRLNNALEAGGVPTDAGIDYPNGRNRAHLTYDLNSFVGTATFRVVSVGGAGAGAVEAEATISTIIATSSRDVATIEWDAAGATLYQIQVVMDSLTTGSLDIVAITHQFVPSLGVSESIRTDPGPTRYAVDRLDSSGNLSDYLSCEGAIPVVLEPGDNHIKLRADEIPALGYTENENKLDRDPIVTVTYDPRYAL